MHIILEIGPWKLSNVLHHEEKHNNNIFFKFFHLFGYIMPDFWTQNRALIWNSVLRHFEIGSWKLFNILESIAFLKCKNFLASINLGP